MLVQDEVIGLESVENATPRPAPTGLEGDGTLQDAVRDLITTYYSLNPTTVPILTEEPSPLQFMRYVSLNTPFVVRNGASNFPARQKWTTNYLTTILDGQTVTVAKTPHGNADSTITHPAGPTLFVKPHETDEPFSTVLQKIQSQEQNATYTGPTHYAQTQNDNLRNEYTSLFADIPPSIPFARIALSKPPDAINFWLGNSHSTTALHKDNYENIYCQILGRKHFTLLPPIAAPCVNEKSVLSATYDAEMNIVLDEPEEWTPFALWDPHVPRENTTRYSGLARPVEVTLEEGDMLYLPALWYHKVRQSCGEERVCVAVNYWYDLEFSGGFWSMASFVRAAGLVSLGEEQGEEEEEEEKDGDKVV